MVDKSMVAGPEVSDAEVQSQIEVPMEVVVKEVTKEVVKEAMRDEPKRQESPVDLQAFNKLKQAKQLNKKQITQWYTEFERSNQRKPNNSEAMEQISGLLQER